MNDLSPSRLPAKNAHQKPEQQDEQICSLHATFLEHVKQRSALQPRFDELEGLCWGNKDSTQARSDYEAVNAEIEVHSNAQDVIAAAVTKLSPGDFGSLLAKANIAEYVGEGCCGTVIDDLREAIVGDFVRIAVRAGIKASADVHPDAALLTIGRHFEAVDAAVLAYDDDDTDEYAPLYELHWRLREKIVETRAATMDGIRVKARAAEAALERNPSADNVGDGSFVSLAKSLLRDLRSPALCVSAPQIATAVHCADQHGFAHAAE